MKKKSIYRRGAAFLAGFFILIAAANAGSSSDQIINANYPSSYQITQSPNLLTLIHKNNDPAQATAAATLQLSSNVAWTLSVSGTHDGKLYDPTPSGSPTGALITPLNVQYTGTTPPTTTSGNPYILTGTSHSFLQGPYGKYDNIALSFIQNYINPPTSPNDKAGTYSITVTWSLSPT